MNQREESNAQLAVSKDMTRMLKIPGHRTKHVFKANKDTFVMQPKQQKAANQNFMQLRGALQT